MDDFGSARKRFKLPSFVLGLAFLFVGVAAVMKPGRAVMGIMWIIAVVM